MQVEEWGEFTEMGKTIEKAWEEDQELSFGLIGWMVSKSGDAR